MTSEDVLLPSSVSNINVSSMGDEKKKKGKNADIAQMIDEQIKTMCDTRRVRPIADLLLIDFDYTDKSFKVVQQRGNHLKTMGFPISNGYGGLHAEEAVYLMEIAAASIVCNRLPISLQQAYLILEQCKVSWPMYLTYTHLKRLGYVVLRYKKPYVNSNIIEDTFISTQSSQSNSNYLTNSLSLPNRSPLPNHLLDSIPNMFKCQQQVLPTDLYPPSITIAADPAKIESKLRQLEAEYCHRSNDDQQPIRPIRLMPKIPDNIRNTNNWYSFKQSKHQWMSMSSTNNLHIFENELKRKVAKNNIDNNDLSSQLTPIFEVHLPSTDYCHSIPTKPDHYVAIANENAQSIASLRYQNYLFRSIDHNRSVSDDIPVHVAIYDAGIVSFFNVTNR